MGVVRTPALGVPGGEPGFVALRALGGGDQVLDALCIAGVMALAAVVAVVGRLVERL